MPVAITIDHWIAADRRVFNSKKTEIHAALQGETGIIDGVKEENKEDIFYMILFCLCVPQSKAVKAEDAIDQLRKLNFYTNDQSFSQIAQILMGKVRFQTTKAKRLCEARKVFFETNFWEKLCTYYNLYSLAKNREHVLNQARNYLISTIKGVGMKLASHLLRNIGMTGLAILDVHIVNGLHKRGIIDSGKLGPSKAEYLEIEQKMKEYAEQVEISLDELDLLLWSARTGFVFK